MATVFIPTSLQKLTDGQDKIVLPGSTVRQIVNNLEAAFPGTKERLVDGFKIKSNISVAVDGEISPMGLLAKVGEQSEVHFLPAIGGGRQG